MQKQKYSYFTWGFIKINWSEMMTFLIYYNNLMNIYPCLLVLTPCGAT